jgi:hypothetical protein
MSNEIGSRIVTKNKLRKSLSPTFIRLLVIVVILSIINVLLLFFSTSNNYSEPGRTNTAIAITNSFIADTITETAKNVQFTPISDR